MDDHDRHDGHDDRPHPTTGVRKLHRSRTERQVAGVCGGLGEYFAIDPTLVRVVMVVLALSGPGLLLYPLLWIVVPAAPPNPSAPPATRADPAPPEPAGGTAA